MRGGCLGLGLAVPPELRAQNPLEQFAGRIARQLSPELDGARHVECGQLLRAAIDDLLFCQGFTFPSHQDSVHSLTPLNPPPGDPTQAHLESNFVSLIIFASLESTHGTTLLR